MPNDLQKRVEDLEKEVHSLRKELNEIKRFTPADTQTTYIATEKTAPSFEYTTPLKPATYEPADDIKQAIQSLKASQQEKPEKSLEERIVWALPKVFMVILVLGVLWGLKLVSDYGYLSDTIKILLSFALSIGLGATAYWMETKHKGSPALTISLYGGTFIIGILTTAAGAIIYEVLTLYVALIIALLYIAYGIWISYLKKNEILTNFVAFTSLLLPYLLNYMEFNKFIILLFIIVLYGLLQIVIVKHLQQTALYVASFFSLLAVQIIWALSSNTGYSFSVSAIILLAIFLYSWWKLYQHVSEKVKVIHESLLFSASALTLLFINLMSKELPKQALMILLVTILLLATARLAYKKQLQRVMDITGTMALLSLLNVLIVLNIAENMENILVPLNVFFGLMIALYLRTTLMKITYSTLFTLTTLVNILKLDVTPFLSVGHFVIFMQLIYMVIIYIYMKRPKEELNTYEKWMKNIYIEDFVPLFISAYFLAYMLKIDVAYFSKWADLPYFVFALVALLMVGSLFVTEKIIGKFVPYMLIGLFILLAVVLMPSQYSLQFEWVNLATRSLYIGILIAIVADLYMRGAIYRKWSRYLEKSHDGVISAGFIFISLSCMSFISQLAYNDVIGYKLAIAAKTILLFATATSALWLSTLQPLRALRLTGFGVLCIAIIKLVFFDLATLDLFIRAILFMTIGGVGLLLSNRLLKKKDE